MVNQPNRQQETLAQAIHRRKSIRAYTGEPLAAEHLAMLKGIAKSAPRLTNTPVRFAFITDKNQIDRIFVGIMGNYGKVKHAPVLLVGLAGPGSHSLESLGFTMEYLILEATRHNLGTCWISGMFSQKNVVETVTLEPGEEVLAVSPLGYPAGSGGGKLLKSLAGSEKRKPLKDIVFAGQWQGDAQALLDSRADLARIAEAVRWAPSAMNRQPWRLILTETAAFLLSTSKKSGLDNGIAMAHWAIAAHEEGIPGQWELGAERNDWREQLKLPGNITWVGRYPLAGHPG